MSTVFSSLNQNPVTEKIHMQFRLKQHKYTQEIVYVALIVSFHLKIFYCTDRSKGKVKVKPGTWYSAA